jgi:hypothetical protein
MVDAKLSAYPIVQSAPETPHGFWNEVTFSDKVEKNLLTQIHPHISTKLQTALCTITVSMEAPRSGKAGFLNFKKKKLGFLAHLYMTIV